MKAIQTKQANLISDLVNAVDTLRTEWQLASSVDIDEEPELAAAIDKVTSLMDRIEPQPLPKGRRVGDLTGFAHALAQHLTEHYPSARVYRISSPEAGQDVEIVLQHRDWSNLKAVTYRADGTWSGLSYWCEGQI